MELKVPLATVALLLGLVGSLSSCALGPSVKVAELREFPECGGWLPVSTEGQVAPQLVRPGNDERWRAPQTREQALELAARARSHAALRPLESSVRFVLSPVLLIPAAHLGAAERAPGRELVECVVLDAAGAPIAGAEVEYLPASLDVASFAHEGLREFGLPRAEAWTPSAAWLESLARTLPRCIVAQVEVEWLGTEVFHGEPPAISDERLSRRETSRDGRAHLLVPGPGFALAWAPGFEPRLEPIVLPATTPLRMWLPPRADRDAVELAVQRLRTAQQQVGRAPFGQGPFQRPGLDFRRLADARAELRKLSDSRELPGWLRGNARLALELALEAEAELCEAASSWWTIPKVQGAEERRKAVRAELAALRATVAPRLRGSEGGVGAWVDDLADWLRRARAVGLPNDGLAPTPERTLLRSEARSLAQRARELDAQHPLLPMLDALGSPTPLDGPTLVHATRHLETDAYFELLHPELRGR